MKKQSKHLILALAIFCVLGLSAKCGGGQTVGDPAGGNGGDTTTPAKAAEKFVMLYATGVSGELVDCGCPSHPRGGLARRTEVARGLAGANPGHFLNVDGGNAFFATYPPGTASDEQKKHALVMAKSLAYMGLNAFNVGPMDLAGGLPFLRDELARAGDTELPFVSANLLDPATAKPIFPAYREFKIGERSACVFGLTRAAAGDNSVQVADPEQTAKAIVGELDGKCDLIVGLFAMPLQAASELVRNVPGVNIVIVSDRSSSPAPKPLVLGDTAIFQAGTRGMYVGRMDVTMLPTKPASAESLSGEEKARVEAELARVVAQAKLLEGDIANDPQLATVYKKAREDEKALREKLGQDSTGYDLENALISLDIAMPEDKQVAAWVDEAGVNARTPVTPMPTAPDSPAH